jgi:hypothetical protein
LGKGFAIFELLIVLPLIIFLLTLSLHRGCFLKKTILDTEVQNLRMVFVYLQQKAIMTGLKQHLVFIPDRNSYAYSRNLKQVLYKLPEQVKFGFIPGAKGPPSSKRNLIKNEITFRSGKKKNFVTFYPAGYISPGSVYLVDSEKLIMHSISVSILKEAYAAIN